MTGVLFFGVPVSLLLLGYGAVRAHETQAPPVPTEPVYDRFVLGAEINLETDAVFTEVVVNAEDASSRETTNPQSTVK